MNKSALQQARSKYAPKLPKALEGNVKAVLGEATKSVSDQEAIAALFPNTYGLPKLTFEATAEAVASQPINVGVILSGGQAPGGHNVIAGIFDGVKKINADGRLYLNRKLAETKRIALTELQDRSATFLEEMEGIAFAVAGERLLVQSSLSDAARALRRSVHNRYLADVYWSLTPGWEVEELADNPSLWLQSTAIDHPCILFGAGVTAKDFDYPILEAPDVVKAIAHVLRIRPPNATR